ncbi:MAG: phosphate transport regulator [Bacteroidetes bacterium CG23_combo_of_CG06-09_8_20_14_all_32_9]|nr:MAG: phosphate transport regulator [Bacteroidetes bacterium CG23_combo_of_CG06-09_8_20_14_all_32_9]
MGINKFFQILVPKDKKFYPYFNAASDNLVDVSLVLCELMKANSWDERIPLINKIKALEKKGDDITHNMFDLLNQSFITPFDREDMNALISSIDDVVDYINGSAQRFLLYKPQSVPVEFIKLADLILDGSKTIKIAIQHIQDLKKPGEIKKACIRVNEIENLADDIYHIGLSQLFEYETNTIELIKKKEIFQVLEKATDKLEDASDVLKSILIKQV